MGDKKTPNVRECYCTIGQISGHGVLPAIEKYCKKMDSSALETPPRAIFMVENVEDVSNIQELLIDELYRANHCRNGDNCIDKILLYHSTTGNETLMSKLLNRGAFATAVTLMEYVQVDHDTAFRLYLGEINRWLTGGMSSVGDDATKIWTTRLFIDRIVHKDAIYGKILLGLTHIHHSTPRVNVLSINLHSKLTESILEHLYDGGHTELLTALCSDKHEITGLQLIDTWAGVKTGTTYKLLDEFTVRDGEKWSR